MSRSQPEASIHKAILSYLRLRFPRGLVVHAANELNLAADPRSKAIAQARAKSLGMMPGWPDLMLLTGGDVLFIEIKSADGRLSPAQTKVHAGLRAAGFAVEIARSVTDAQEICDAWCSNRLRMVQ